MKIGFYLGDYNNVGGIERVTTTLSNYMADVLGHEVEIISSFKGRPEPAYSLSKSVKVHYITEEATGSVPHSMKRIIKRLTNVVHVRRFFKTHKYDLIIAQAFPNNLSLFLAGKDMSNVISAEHVYANYYGSFIKSIRNFIYRRSAKIVVLTGNDKEYFDTVFSSNHTLVIPNPVILTEKHYSSLVNKEIISLGRLQYQKGYDNLVDIFNSVHKRYPDWHLSIYGEGALRKELQQKIDSLGLSDFMHLKGLTTDVPAVLRQSSIYVMSSRFEGFPMVLIEAMNQGVPCVSYRCPNGPSDIIQDGHNGLLVEDQNAAQLADAICYMIENDEERKQMGKNSCDSIDKYSASSICSMWECLFNDLKK